MVTRRAALNEVTVTNNEGNILFAAFMYALIALLVYFGWNTFVIDVTHLSKLDIKSSFGLSALLWATHIFVTMVCSGISEIFRYHRPAPEIKKVENSIDDSP